MSHKGLKNYQSWTVLAWIENDRILSPRSLEIVRDSSGDRLDRISEIAEKLERLVNLPSLDGLVGSLFASVKEMIDWREIAQKLLDDEVYENSEEDGDD